MDPIAIGSMLDTAIEELDFSGVVSIRQSDEVIYQRAAGFADRSGQIKNKIDTRFGIASGTKFFTAMAIGNLFEAGLISPSTLLRDCLKLDFPNYAGEITIEHLLSHTSGIPDYYDEEKIDDCDNFTVAVPWSELRGPRDYLAVFPKDEMKFPPGERFSYSNGGYILLGVIIEEMSGRPYQEFVEEKIFKPAGMIDSGYFAMNQLPGNTALGYIDGKDGWRTNIFNLPIVGASDGGAYSTVGDISSLWRAWWGNKILNEENVALFSKPLVKATSEGKFKSYGHGLWLHEEGAADREIYFEGCDAGVSFRSTSILAHDLQVTVISNTTDGAWPILRKISSTINPPE